MGVKLKITKRKLMGSKKEEKTKMKRKPLS